MIDWEEREELLPPIEQLHAEAELLRMIEYWRERAEHLERLLQSNNYTLSPFLRQP